MKYEILSTNYSNETSLNENEYSCHITIGLHPTDGIIPDFMKTITVISNNAMTGFEVDEQRNKAVTDYINLINK